MDGEPAHSTGLESELDDAMSRLESVLRGVLPGAVGVSFDPSMPVPERELLASLGAIAGGDAAPSFSTEGTSQADERAASRVLEELIDRARTFARVETEGSGRVVVSTWVGRDGDIISSVAPTLDPEAIPRHLAALGQTLRERRERAKLLLSILEMASKIALAAGTGNPLVAVLAALKFIRDIVAERAERDAQRGTT
jgi:hypothetical protein